MSSVKLSSKKLRKILKAVVIVVAVIVASSFLAYSTFGQVKIGDASNSKQATLIYLDYNELVTMPRSTVYAELYCYGSLVERGNWTGVKLKLVLEKAGLSPQAGTAIEFYASDGYSIELPFSVAMREDVIIAYEKDDKPLTETTRLVVPGENGAEWIGMITQIKIVNS